MYVCMYIYITTAMITYPYTCLPTCSHQTKQTYRLFQQHQ